MTSIVSRAKEVAGYMIGLAAVFAIAFAAFYIQPPVQDWYIIAVVIPILTVGLPLRYALGSNLLAYERAIGRRAAKLTSSATAVWSIVGLYSMGIALLIANSASAKLLFLLAGVVLVQVAGWRIATFQRPRVGLSAGSRPSRPATIIMTTIVGIGLATCGVAGFALSIVLVFPSTVRALVGACSIISIALGLGVLWFRRRISERLS